jgi:hypothetical protein
MDGCSRNLHELLIVLFVRFVRFVVNNSSCIHLQDMTLNHTMSARTA